MKAHRLLSVLLQLQAHRRLTARELAERLEVSVRTVQRDKERVDRTVDPLGLVAKGGVWYLVAGTPAGLRTYRVSRIEQATLLDQPCERPAQFDLATHWESSTEEFRRSWERYAVILRLEPSAAASLQRWRRTEPIEDGGGDDPDGWVTLRAGFEDEEQARFIVLGCGPRAEVLAPAELRDAVAADQAAAVELHRDLARK